MHILTLLINLCSRGATFTCILSHIHTKLNDVTRQDFTGGTLFRAPAQALTVDEGAIAALGVLEIKLEEEEAHVIRVPRSPTTIPIAPILLAK